MLFNNRTRTFSWSGRGARVGDGVYSVRVRAAGTSQRFAFVRRGGRFSARPAFERREGCGLVARFKLERPAFGGGRTGRCSSPTGSRTTRA